MSSILLNGLLGVGLIGLGILIKYNPDLMAGYHDMTPEQKKKVNIQAVSTWMMHCSILFGLFFLSVPYLTRDWGDDFFFGRRFYLVFIPYIFIVMLGAIYYEKKPQK